MSKPMALDEFIRRAKAVHGSKYDYSCTEYCNMRTKVCVRCKIHGEFLQLPHAHLDGQGCPKCGKKKLQQIMAARYGVDNPMKLRTFFDKARDTCREKYGADWAMSNNMILSKRMITNQARYGADKISDLPAVCENTQYSLEELLEVREKLYAGLCEIFGYDDILCEYHSIAYPHDCDFYVKSRDLYIELHAEFFHGCHWYDANSESDVSMIQSWDACDIDVWTCKDIIKREDARRGNLNYVVFWGEKGEDMDLWFAMGCPDGQDWRRVYSWLPQRDVIHAPAIPKLTGTMRNLSQVAKAYQFDVFFARELKLWKDNPVFRKLDLRTWLYLNRLHYLNKRPGGPGALTDLEVMRGFNISGILRGYTVFNASLMDEFVARYDIKSIYDPCAGWGERMLYAYTHDIVYFGVDVNQDLKPGYMRMMSDFAMRKQRVVFADSAVYQPNVLSDAVITCPPYGDIEKYSPYGAENLNETDFLAWWDAVVKNSKQTGAKYFAFQVNQRWRNPMASVIASNDYYFVDELFGDNALVGHFNRKSGQSNKREFESFLIFEKS